MPRVTEGGTIVDAPPVPPPPQAAPVVPPILFVASAPAGDIGPYAEGAIVAPDIAVLSQGYFEPGGKFFNPPPEIGQVHPGAGDETVIPDETVTPVPPDRTLEAAVLGRFAGIGMFTNQHPGEAINHANVLDWIAIQVGVGSARDAAAAKAAGLRVMVWESSPSQGQRAVDIYDADGYIAQAESGAQLRNALALADGLNVPKALVTNLDFETFPNDWVCLPEAYANANPNATVPNMVARSRSKGATAIAPVLGVYDATSEGGRRLSAAAYSSGLSTVGIGSFSIFTAETMNDEDWQWLANRQAAPPPVVTVPDKVSVLPQTGADFYEPGAYDEPRVPIPGGLLTGGAITPETVAKAVKANGPVNAWFQFLQVFSRRLPIVSRQLTLSAGKIKTVGKG